MCLFTSVVVVVFNVFLFACVLFRLFCVCMCVLFLLAVCSCALFRLFVKCGFCLLRLL